MPFPGRKRRVLSLYTEAETNVHLDDEPVEKYSSSSGEENAVKPEPFGETMAATEIGTNKTQITENRLERSDFLKKLNELSREELADPKKRAHDDEHAFADAFDGDSSPDSYRYESDSGLDHSNTSEIDSDGEKTKKTKNGKIKKLEIMQLKQDQHVSVSRMFKTNMPVKRTWMHIRSRTTEIISTAQSATSSLRPN
ncbi:hypothetical protein HF325_005997 [Metschnikowia pulcherrima]|uniref:Uncharacterized protein n=1 Tax=Metschnikowia pulcherrima TaxID=27326 RepID=A0A8H7L7A5_9ASCO|nr:hypothetical protein HF325_005997 [Metschnikowia pulcherrima]